VLHVAPPPNARVVVVKLRSDTAVAITDVGGVPTRAPMKPGAWLRIRWDAAQAGFDVGLRPGGPGALDLAYAATIERWPSAATSLPARPRDVMPFDLSDSTVLQGRRRFSW
jgi:hypothetical protein